MDQKKMTHKGQGRLELELMKGSYDPDEAEILLKFLQELEQAKKRKALSEWLKDHNNVPSPQDRPEVKELERMQRDLQELLDEAKWKRKPIDLDLEGHFRAPASENGSPS